MLLKIVQAGDPVLRQAARPLTPEEIAGPEVQQLIELMRRTMYDAPGVGLAAPQIGLPLQLAVIADSVDDPVKERRPVAFHVIVNPRITLGRVGEGEPRSPEPVAGGAGPSQGPESIDLVEHFEGCLSVEGLQAVVPRAREVTVEALDGAGQPVTIHASGWYARILQHEIDHLHGTLYVDRMRSRTLSTNRNVALHGAGLAAAEAAARRGASTPKG
jgi:peptide deformylase